jgi:hypothetical protein
MRLLVDIGRGIRGPVTATRGSSSLLLLQAHLLLLEFNVLTRTSASSALVLAQHALVFLQLNWHSGADEKLV